MTYSLKGFFDIILIKANCCVILIVLYREELLFIFSQFFSGAKLTPFAGNIGRYISNKTRWSDEICKCFTEQERICRRYP